MKKLILAFSLFCFSCATTHHGIEGKSLDPAGSDLKVTVDPIDDYSDETNIYLDFAMENTSSRWLKVDQVSIDFPTQDNLVHNVIVGDDLKVWAESLDNKMRMKNYNSRIGMAALMLGGAAVALLGIKNGDTGLTSVGTAATAAGAVWDATRRMKDGQRNSQTSFKVPETYLLAPFTVPSHGLIRRWVLVNIPQKLIAKNALITLKTIEGETMRYEVPIQFPSNWLEKK